MAKKSSIEKSDRRRRMTKQWANRRKKLKAIAHDKKLPMEERFAATVKLAELPRNSSATRVRNRCALSGRLQGPDPGPREVELVGASRWLSTIRSAI